MAVYMSDFHKKSDITLKNYYILLFKGITTQLYHNIFENVKFT